tara:strand:- start:72 stop:245 length:174 start_codon:yes stop_codon:yes gene_type:complete
MDENNLMHEDLSTMLIVIGSYLYGGGDIQEIDHIILDRVSELIDKHLDGVTENMSVH